MAQMLAKALSLTQTEYSVYVYHLPENQLEGQNDWEMRSAFEDLSAAMEEAYRLLSSRNFKKIEVKRRQRNPQTQTAHEKTVKILNFSPCKRKILRRALRLLRRLRK